MSCMHLAPKDIDQVDYGVMVYDSAGVCLGRVERYLQMNGNRAAIERRHLNNGQPKDRFAYRRSALYEQAKESGPVYIHEERCGKGGE